MQHHEDRRRATGAPSAPGAGAHVDDAIASLVHELRTPLTAVRGFLETVLDRGDELDAEQRDRLLRVAHRNADTLTQRVQEILEVHRLGSGGMKLPTAALDVTEVLEQLVTDCRVVTADRTVVIDAPRGVLVDLNVEAVHHVLSNILSNAAIHSPRDSTIRISVGTGVDDVSISVSDEGDGIAPEILPYVFQRGYRAGHHQRGNGIGLSVAARYVALSGGRIAITSTGETGTTVTFTLPRTPPSVARIIAVDETTAAAKARRAAAAPGAPELR